MFSSPKGSCHHLSLSINFYILIFFSATTGKIGTKLDRNIHLMVPYSVYVLFCWSEEMRGPKVSKTVCPYIWVYIIYCSFVFLWGFFLMHSKNLSETCITLLCNYSCWGGGFKPFYLTWPKAMWAFVITCRTS